MIKGFMKTPSSPKDTDRREREKLKERKKDLGEAERSFEKGGITRTR